MRTGTVAVLLAVFLGSVSCGRHDAVQVTLGHDGGKVDLAAQLPGDWARVCILTPYIRAERASRVLGFSYYPGMHSAIDVRDDITLLVTVTGDEDVTAYEVKRSNMDFASLGVGCYVRSRALFHYREMEGGWHQLSAPDTPRSALPVTNGSDWQMHGQAGRICQAAGDAGSAVDDRTGECRDRLRRG